MPRDDPAIEPCPVVEEEEVDEGVFPALEDAAVQQVLERVGSLVQDPRVEGPFHLSLGVGDVARGKVRAQLGEDGLPGVRHL